MFLFYTIVIIGPAQICILLRCLMAFINMFLTPSFSIKWKYHNLLHNFPIVGVQVVAKFPYYRQRGGECHYAHTPPPSPNFGYKALVGGRFLRVGLLSQSVLLTMHCQIHFQRGYTTTTMHTSPLFENALMLILY